MRQIGTLTDKNQAQVFSDYLYTKGINHKIQSDDKNGFEIWVDSEDQIDESKFLLSEYLNDPKNIRYKEATGTASHMRAQEKKKQESYRDQFYDKSKIFQTGIPFLTFSLIGISVCVTLVSLMGENKAFLNYFYITMVEISGGYIRWNRGLPEIMSGQVWRLITPIFIHFGILHIVFNMLWLKDLGGMIEQKHSPWMLGIMILVMGALSNLGQYYVDGPMFGGMSGVVYGLFGYVWLRGKFDPFSGFYMHPQTVWMMVIWFFLCLFHIIPNVANTAHGVGFAIGCAWGYFSAVISKR